GGARSRAPPAHPRRSLHLARAGRAQVRDARSDRGLVPRRQRGRDRRAPSRAGGGRSRPGHAAPVARKAVRGARRPEPGGHRQAVMPPRRLSTVAAMEDVRGKVAVVTGGASGIGRAMATRFAAEGMNVVIADIEEGPLQATSDELGVYGVRTDVTDAASVAALADATLERFGAVHVVCNNAGVGGGGLIKDLTLKDWQWVINVSLWGVIHGVHTFLPHLLQNPDGGHIVNTA